MIGVLLRVACGLMIGSHMPFIFVLAKDYGKGHGLPLRLTWHAFPAFVAAGCLLALTIAGRPH